MSIGKRIKELRIKNKMTQQYVADTLNVGKGSVSKWERDETIPDILKFNDLCNLFNTNLEYLINGKTSNEVDMNKVWIEEEKKEKEALSKLYKNSLIRLENVSKIYTEHGSKGLGLNNVNLAFNMGEFVAITGKSGSGKSTLLNILTQLDTFDEGEYLFDNKPFSNLKSSERDSFRNKYISFVFQKYNVIENVSVINNVNTALIFCKYKGNIEQRSLELINLVGLGDRIHTKAINLSGGQKQRLVIARELAKEAPILALDEPTGNLDYETSKEILELIYNISKDKLVLLVTHDFRDVKKYATRYIELKDGYIVEDKIISEIQSKELPKTIINPINKREFFKLSFKDLFLNKRVLLNSLLLSMSLLIIAFTMFMVRSELSYQFTYAYYSNHQQKAVVFSENTISKETLDLFNNDNMFAYEQDINDKLFDYRVNMITRSGENVELYMQTEQIQISNFIDNGTTNTGEKIYGSIPLEKNEIIIPLHSDIIDLYDTSDIIGSTITLNINPIYSDIDQIELRVVGYYEYYQYQDHETGEYKLLYITKEMYQELNNMTNEHTFTLYRFFGSSEIVENSNVIIDDTLNEDGVHLDSDNGIKICYYYGNISETDEDFIDKCNDHLSAQSSTLYLRVQDIFGNNIRKEYPVNIDIINSTDYLDEIVGLLDIPEIEFKVNDITYKQMSESDLKVYYDLFVVYFRDDLSVEAVKSLAAENDLMVYYEYDVENTPEQFDLLQYRLAYAVITIIAFLVFFVIEFIVNKLFKRKLESIIVLRSIGASKKEISIMLVLQNVYILLMSVVTIITILILVYLMNINIRGIEINSIFKEVIFNYISMKMIVDTILIYSFVRLTSTLFIVVSIYKKSINAVLAEIR